MRRRQRFALLPILAAALAAIPAIAMAGAIPALASTVQLTRYPYLTDVVTTNATLNWATDQSQTSGYATYGAVGTEACTTHRANASKTGVTVNGVLEYQWKAMMTSLTPSTQYCYRVFFSATATSPAVDLLGSDPDPQFRSMLPAGSSTPFTFAVTADWGSTGADGTNPDQANLDHQIAASGASFVLGAGDTAYPGGSETNYGDLNQTGADISGVFGPSFWKNVGDSLPMFNALGNHGQNATHLGVWPQTAAVAGSGGRYQMDTYCCVNGTKTFSYPSAWYAFDAGPARIYVLDAAWADGNLGTGTLYSNDKAAHWTAGVPEYDWLASDLAAHPSGLKFAVMHFPMYTDNSTEISDPYMHGPGSPGALLSQYGVPFVFNGHAHLYERNTAQPGESFVSYVVGGGGGTLEPVSNCGSYDAYALGWSPTTSAGSACGAAPVPSAASKVYSFLRVSVNGTQVKIEPTDENGNTFDVQTFTIAATSVPGAPQGVSATAGDGAATVAFSPPALTGGSPITGYTITPSPACSACTGTTPTGTSSTVGGLTNGTAYTFTVSAVNGVGTGAPSAASNSVTPAAAVSVPGAPQGVSATAGDGAATVAFSPPALTGGSPITGYTITPSPACSACTGTTPTGTSSTVRGLTNGTAYTFTVTATNAVGSSAASAPSVAATPMAPLPAVERYVIRVYSDLFNRAPDPSGLAGWTAALNRGTPRVAVANAITSSAEYRSKLITGSYLHYLGRTPDAGGLATWLAAMGRGMTIEQMQSGFIASPEYYAKSGSTYAGWVTNLYADVLGRSAAPSEVVGWTTQLSRGMRRDRVAMGFLLSTEHLTTVVNGYYVDLLGRGIDPSGQRTWVGILQRGGRDEAIIGGIIASAEYYGRL